MQSILTLQQGWIRGRRQSSVPDTRPAPSQTVATLSIVLIGPQLPSKDVHTLYATDQDTYCTAILMQAAAPVPTVADFSSGTTSDYISLGQLQLLQTGTAMFVDLPDGLSGMYRLALLPEGGSDADIAVSDPVSISTVAPNVPTVQRATRVIQVDAELVQNETSPSTFTAVAGPNRLIMALVTYTNGSPAATGFTLSLGPQAFTEAQAHGSTTTALPKINWYYILDADIPTGAQTLSFTSDEEIRDVSITLIEISGVNQVSPVGAPSLQATLDFVETVSDALTTTTDNSLVLSAISLAVDTATDIAVTSDSGFTPVSIPEHSQPNTMRQSAAFYDEMATAGTVQHDWAWLAASRYSTRMIEVRGIA